MSLFTSSLEKRLWISALVVTLAIYATLFLGRPLLELLGNQNIQAILFLLGMVLVAVVIAISGILTQNSKTVFVIFFGILAVYLMFFLRLGLAERSHLIEYGVLTILVYNALLERKRNGKKISAVALKAIVITFLIGCIDEYIQLLIPNRYFDFTDILFNGMVIILAVIGSLVLTWLRSLLSKNIKRGN